MCGHAHSDDLSGVQLGTPQLCTFDGLQQQAQLRTLFLTSAYPLGPQNRGPEWLVRNSCDARVMLTDDAELADVIIFVENHPGNDPYFFEVLRHPIRRKFPSKSVLYHDADLSVTLMRTLSPSIERWQMSAGFLRPFHYLARLCENQAAKSCSISDIEDDARQYLCSFVGTTRTHSIRKRLLEVRVPGSFYHDTGQERAWELDSVRKNEYEQMFVGTTLVSHFVLCPRGCGPCTYRLFEAMQLGRAPVVISDQWVPPEGPDWDSFCLRISEREVDCIESVLCMNLDRSREMGVAARHAWETYFSPRVTLSRLVEQAMTLTQLPCRRRQRIRAASQFLTPFHLRGIGRHVKRRLIG